MNKKQFRTFILTSLVWAISGIDLLLFVLLSTDVQKRYFPNTDVTISILAIYGTLSLSLLARVFGGLYFSRLADFHGRKAIVILCLTMMSLTIMLFPIVIPSVHKDIEPLPSTIIPLLFVISRIIIGFFIGGIWPIASILAFETIADDDWKKKNANQRSPILTMDILKKKDEEFEKNTKKLSIGSAIMQSGYFWGYLVVSFLYFTNSIEVLYNFINYILCKVVLFLGYFITMILHFNNIHEPIHSIIQIHVLPDYNTVGAFDILSVLMGISGFIIIAMYRKYIPKSELWISWRYLYNILIIQKENLENKSLLIFNFKNIDWINKQINYLDEKKEKLEPGFNKIFADKKYRNRTIGFWLVLSGLMYMSYSMIIILPTILSFDNFTLSNNSNTPPSILTMSYFNPPGPHQTVTLILMISAVSGHFFLCIFLFMTYECGKFNRFKGITYYFLRHLEGTTLRIKKKIELLLDVPTLGNREQNIANDTDFIQNNADFIWLKIIGYSIIVVGIIASIIFFIFIKYNNQNTPIHIVFIISIIAAFFSNLNWASLDSMLSSRFPTHIRSTGTSLAYNGGLSISFASPFVMMEFFLYYKSEYVIFIAMILGAISIILGVNRLIRHEKE